jgi:hypothetical protein
VLDGLQSTDDWDSLKVAFDLSNFCCEYKIIVVTYEQSVARHCANNINPYVINVKGLDADAFNLFSQKVHTVQTCPNKFIAPVMQKDCSFNVVLPLFRKECHRLVQKWR